MDKHLPKHRIKAHPKDKLWNTEDIKIMISKRQHARSSDHKTSLFTITKAQVEAKLKRQRLYKATGPDEIPNWVLKFYAPALAGPICSIFNASIAQGVIPSPWKCADSYTKVPKPKSVDSDLRPISLTPVF